MAIIDKPSDYFNTVLYTGDGTSGRNITGVGFQPDWVWIKNRDNGARYHTLNDSVRGVNKQLFSNRTNAEETDTEQLQAFISDGFTVGNNANTNEDYSYLEVNFISISNSFTLIFDKLLENHQIKIRKYMSGIYIKSFLREDETELSVMANKLYNGLNKNEVKLISKTIENRGFFEKFFQLFS